MMLEYILAIISAYLIGSIPSGLILGKVFWHTDLRKYGSHNMRGVRLGKFPAFLSLLQTASRDRPAYCLGCSLLGPRSLP